MVCGKIGLDKATIARFISVFFTWEEKRMGKGNPRPDYKNFERDASSHLTKHEIFLSQEATLKDLD